MRLLPVYLEKVGQHWCVVIRLSRTRGEALLKARRIARKLAPSELMPRRMDGKLAEHGRETYDRKDDPKSRG